VDPGRSGRDAEIARDAEDFLEAGLGEQAATAVNLDRTAGDPEERLVIPRLEKGDVALVGRRRPTLENEWLTIG
jgi:hypothetical protein